MALFGVFAVFPSRSLASKGPLWRTGEITPASPTDSMKSIASALPAPLGRAASFPTPESATPVFGPEPVFEAMAAAPGPKAPEPEPAAFEPDPAPAMGRLTAFTWTGNGADDDWDTTDNWSPATGYPDDCNDDATIPSGTWDIVAITVQIDDLTVSGSVDFSGTGAPNTLKADSIELSGSNDITLTFSNCVVKTFGCP